MRRKHVKGGRKKRFQIRNLLQIPNLAPITVTRMNDSATEDLSFYICRMDVIGFFFSLPWVN